MDLHIVYVYNQFLNLILKWHQSTFFWINNPLLKRSLSYKTPKQVLLWSLRNINNIMIRPAVQVFRMQLPLPPTAEEN